MRRPGPVRLRLQAGTCLSENPPGLPGDQYNTHFPREVVTRPDDPRDWQQREALYRQRLDQHLRALPGAQACRTLRLGYAEGGNVRAVVRCDAPPPLTIRPGLFH